MKLTRRREDGRHRGRRRRFVPLVWLGGVVAAVLMVLGVNGSLAAWSASIDNTQNTVATGSLVLRETGTGADGTTAETCNSSDATATCTTINKYGATGKTAVLAPGQTASSTVVLSNTGTLAAAGFTLTAGACGQTPVVNLPATGDLCGALTVSIACTGGATLSYGPATLTAFAAAPQTLATGLPAGGTSSCQFTVTLPTTAATNLEAITVTQALTWELTAGS